MNQLAMLLRAARYMVGDDHKALQAAEAEAAKFKLQWENQCRAADVEKAELKAQIVSWEGNKRTRSLHKKLCTGYAKGLEKTAQEKVELEIRIAKLQQEPSESLEHFETRLKTLEKNHKEELARLNDLLVEAVDGKHKVHLELEVLEKKLKVAEEERDQHQDNFTAMLEAHQKAIADCETREADLQKDRDYYFEANKKTQDEYVKALDLTTEAQQLSTKLQQEAKEDTKHITDVQAQRDEWMEKAQERKEAVKTLEEQVALLTEERNHWVTKATDKDSRINHLELKTAKLLEEYGVLDGMHNAQMEEIRALQQDKQATRARVDGVTQNCKKLQVANEGLFEALESEKSKGAALSRQNEELKTESDQHRAAADMYHIQAKRAGEKLTGQAIEISELNGKYDALMGRYQELEAALEGKLQNQEDIKMDTNIDNLKKGSIVACTTDGNSDSLQHCVQVFLLRPAGWRGLLAVQGDRGGSEWQEQGQLQGSQNTRDLLRTLSHRACGTAGTKQTATTHC